MARHAGRLLLAALLGGIVAAVLFAGYLGGRRLAVTGDAAQAIDAIVDGLVPLLVTAAGQRPHSHTAPAMTATRLVVGSSRHRMVVRLAPNLNVIAATVPLRQLLGRGPQELLTRSFLELIHPDDVLAVRRALKEALHDGEAHNVTFRI